MVEPRPFTAFVELREGLQYGYITPSSEAARESLMALVGSVIALRPREGSSATWEATVRLEIDPYRRVFRGEVLDLKLDRPGEATYFRIIYKGIKLPGYTRQAWLQASKYSRAAFGYSYLRALDRDIVISDAGNAEELTECYVGITIAAPYISQLDCDALEMVVYLLAGTGGIRQCVESVDRNGRRVAINMHRLGHAASRTPRLIFGPEQYTRADFYDSAAGLCENARSLIGRGVPLRALLFHVFASQQPVPEITITHLAIALDGIKTAVVEKVRGEGNLMDSEAFKRRIKSVVDAANTEFSKDGGEILRHIVGRIENSNNWSENKRWNRFWNEYIGYKLTEPEQEVLKHRGSAIHSAYILLTEYDLSLNKKADIDRRPYEQRLRDLLFDAAIYRNVLNRVLLKLLGFRGEFVDLTEPFKGRLTIE